MLPITDPAIRLGWTVFETALALGGEVPRWEAHLDRLEASAREACVPMPPRDLLTHQVTALAEAHGGTARIRVTLTGGGRTLLTAEDVDPSRRSQPLRAVTGPHVDEPFLGGAVKHGSRAPWVVAVARSGVDEVLLVDADGRFTEGTTCGILAVIDGAIWTAPHDGRILASTSIQALLDGASTLGLTVHRQGAMAAGPFDGLYVASATRWIAPVVELDGRPLPGWEPVGRRLAAMPGGY